MDEKVVNFKIIRNIILVLAVVLVGWSIRLQIVEGKKYSRLSEENRIRRIFNPAPRGRILDRNGVEVANTRPGFYVSVVRAAIDDETLSALSRILGMSIQDIVEKSKIEKNIYNPVKIAHDISYEQLSLIEERIDLFNGVEVGVEPLRHYPYNDLLFHLVGYVGEITCEEIEGDPGYVLGDYIGKMGVERYYEKILKGTHGIEYVEVDAKGKEVGKIAEKRSVPPTPGVDVNITIDIALTESISVYLEDFEKAACVCLNPKNGAVLALYSKPSFDPNLFIHGLNSEEWNTLLTDPSAPMYNRVTMSCYPPGSTFKTFIALAALDSRMTVKEKRFEPCLGLYRLGRRDFKCWKRHGSLDLINAIVHSCDVYFYQLGRAIGIDTIAERTSRFGFGKRTGIDLHNEKAGNLPGRSWLEKRYGMNWTQGHIFNLSIGQGDLLVTPLQLACAYSLFVNDGKIPMPHVISRNDTTYFTTNISTEAIETVKNALIGVVERGTATAVRIPGIPACGKTGTSQNPHGDDHALFAGYAPVDDPQILVCVLVENAGHGGSIAAPITRRIIEAYLNSLDHADSLTSAPSTSNVQED
ncbi:MAG: penicillin-binding protein 2 [candidate division WOR-3 bacterium]|nr:MAG: penicillin-binding protein 2 [candidate division WOR-3 bacterium]